MADYKSNIGKNKGSQSYHIANQLGKLPPQVVELEESVLGALMIESSSINLVIDILKVESFYKTSHQEIYRAVFELFAESEPIDMLTVTQQLRKKGKLEMVGGAPYIMRLTSSVNSAANIEYHARIITEQAIKRELIQIASDIHRNAYDDGTDVFDLLDFSEQQLFQISESNIRKNVSTMYPLVQRAIKELEDRKDIKDGLTGIATGFTGLDRVTAGWQRSDLIILAARPGMGKCLHPDTKVLMYDGTFKKAKEIRPQDQLMGSDSKPRRVLSIGQGQEKMYFIHQKHGISYQVNESHILSLKSPRRPKEVINISVKEYLAQSASFKKNHRGYKVAVEFASQELPSDPYLLGWQLGQQISLDTGLDSSRPSFGDTSTLTKPKSTLIPPEYLLNKSSTRQELLAGLMDAQGRYLSTANHYQINVSDVVLAQQIKFIADTLGLRTQLEIQEDIAIYEVKIWGDLRQIPVKIAHKKARPWQGSEDWQLTEIEVAYHEVGEYFGFELDGDGLFLLEDMTVTHNTAFSLSAMRNAAIDFNHPVAFFSLEMSEMQLVNRLISAEAELEGNKIKRGNLAEYEWQQLYQRTNKIMEAPIFIDDTPALSVLELRAKCRRLKAQHDIQLIIVDYLQLMTANTGRAQGNREQEIALISRSLKGIAKELNVPVIALSQLSRAVETRGGDKRPQLSDLRESGSIEQDADLVIFLYRPEYYGITQDMEGNPTAGVGEVIIAKHRNGSLEDVKLKFIGKYTKFANLEEEGFDFGNTEGEGKMVTFSSKANEKSNFENHSGKRLDDEPPF